VGIEYLSWEQTVAWARLLHLRVRDLAHPDAEPRHQESRPRRRMSGLAILSFEPAVVAAATATAGPIGTVGHDGHHTA